MSIDCELFSFAGVPRTATAWIKRSCLTAGLKARGNVHSPHSEDDPKIKLSTVRHPVDWMASWWSTFGRDRLFDDFVRVRLASGKTVGSMFDACKADVVIRVEDLPWAFVEFLQSLGLSGRDCEACLKIPRINPSHRRPTWNPDLLKRVIESESGMMEKYDY